MKLLLTCFGMAAALMLLGCSSGGKSPWVQEFPELPLQTPRYEHQAPTVDLGGTLHVGADIAPRSDQLPLIDHHGETRVFHGWVRDGLGAAEVIEYLEADAASYRTSDEDDVDVPFLSDGLLLRFGKIPPTVRVAQGTSAELVDETVRVVQAINAALPRDWQLGFSAEPAPLDTIGPSDGEILVAFARQEDWPFEATSPIVEDIGLAEPRYTIVLTGDPVVPWRIEIVAGQVWVDPSRTVGEERLGVLAHELIHLLGRNHADPDRFPRTIMVAGGSEELTEHILHALDREALLAVYSRLEPGTAPDQIAEELGPWSDTSMHVRGAIDVSSDKVAFGVALRNGLSQPWVVGPWPHSNLVDNAELLGNVSWTGRLLGITPVAEAVAGAASLTVELATLSGGVEFTGLEHWAVNAAPGKLGTGAVWGDGELSYRIEVRGNTFAQTSGDVGTVTGSFFGSDHEGMGGVLERDDLAAGFGGTR